MAENFATLERRTPNAERHNSTQKSPVRIAVILGKLSNGGLDYFVLNCYRNIDRNKIQYDIMIDSDSSDWTNKHKFEELGARVFVIPPYQKQFSYQKALFRIFKENKYPLVISHINSLSVFPLFAAWRAGIPIRIASNHSTAGKGEFKRNIMKYILRFVAKLFPTHLCACSNYAGRWLFGKKAAEEGRITVWLTSIEPETFAYNESVRAEVRRELHLEEKFVIGHIGRFVNQKNHDFLVDIFAKILRRREDSVLLLAGDGPLMKNIKEKVVRLGIEDSVIFLGGVYDPEKYYQAMDVFIFPSLYEGLGRVAVEAQTAGLPVLCSDEIPIEAKICENMRFMSLKKSASEWAQEALKMYDGHIRRDMSIYAREAGFDVKAQAAKLSEWYCQLLGI